MQEHRIIRPTDRDMTLPITDYQQACASHELTIPEFYNFGFDCIDAWAQD